MSKLRSDSVFNQLTPEQAETLEGWLLEEGLAYKDVLEKVKAEFKLETSLSGLKRYYQRLAGERSKESLTDTIAVCVEAMGMAAPGVLAGGFWTLAQKCAVEFMGQSPGIREFTALLRVMISAQALEMKRIEFQRGEDERRERQLEEERKKLEEEERSRKWAEEWNAKQKEREEKKKAKAAAKAEAMSNDQGQMTKGQEESLSVHATSTPASGTESGMDGAVGSSKSSQAPVAPGPKPEEHPVPPANQPRVIDLAEYARVTGRDACYRNLID